MNTRAIAVSILDSLGDHFYAYEKSIEKRLRYVHLSQADRNFVYALVKGTVQMQRLLDYILDFAVKQGLTRLEKTARNLLRVGAYQRVILETPAHAAVNETVQAARQLRRKDLVALVNGVLRNLPSSQKWQAELEKRDDAEQLSIRYSHPLWLVRRWWDRWGPEKTCRLLGFNNRDQEIYFRQNPVRGSWEALQDRLGKLGLRLKSEHRLAGFVYFSVDQPATLLKSPLFAQRACSVQDFSQSFAALLLQAQVADVVLDLCAAPGGKTSQLAQMITSDTVLRAYDRDPDKVAQLREECRRLGLESVKSEVADARTSDYISADCILVDAPCTGTGVIARHADIRWNREESDIEKMTRLQGLILANAARFVRPGGTLVYSTCSIEPEENWGVVDHFMNGSEDFSVDRADRYVDAEYCDDRGAVQLWPFKQGLTGSFAVRLIRDDRKGERRRNQS